MIPTSFRDLAARFDRPREFPLWKNALTPKSASNTATTPFSLGSRSSLAHISQHQCLQPTSQASLSAVWLVHPPPHLIDHRGFLYHPHTSETHHCHLLSPRHPQLDLSRHPCHHHRHFSDDSSWVRENIEHHCCRRISAQVMMVSHSCLACHLYAPVILLPLPDYLLYDHHFWIMGTK